MGDKGLGTRGARIFLTQLSNHYEHIIHLRSKLCRVTDLWKYPFYKLNKFYVSYAKNPNFFSLRICFGGPMSVWVDHCQFPFMKFILYFINFMKRFVLYLGKSKLKTAKKSRPTIIKQIYL